MKKSDWQRLNQIFGGALQLDATQQSEFLRHACAGDESLLREAEAILAASRKAVDDSFLSADLFSNTARMLAAYETQMKNKRIGRYRIDREIGQGGMGTVYLAEREEFKQWVALKLIKRGMDTEEIIRRFERERVVLASLNHSNIARLLDGGETETGLPYLVMDLVQGLPITEFCDRRRLSIADRLRLFVKVCAPVAYAHEKLIVHRDIKPSNVLVSSYGEPKLVDFGISKILAYENSETTIEQTRGPTLMTPEYASPEQVRGERVEPASDIYSLGVLLYELLCGRLPLRLKDVPYVQIVKIVSEQQPTAPSTAAVTKIEHAQPTKEMRSPELLAELRRERPESLRSLLRGDLDNITLKALAKDHTQRYRLVEELTKDIQSYLEGRPVVARPLTFSYRATKFARRNRTSVVLAAMLALLVIATGVSWLYFLSRPGRDKRGVETQVPARNNPRKIAVLPFKINGAAVTDIALDVDLTETLIGRLSRIEELEVRPASAVVAFANAEPLVAARTLNVEAVLESIFEGRGDRVIINSRLLKADDGQSLWSGSFEETLAEISTAQDAIAERVAGTLLGQLSVEQRKKVRKRYTDNAEAYKLYLQGKAAVNKQSEQSLKQSIQFFNRALEVDPGYALAYAGIADAYFGLSNVYLSAHEAFPKAKAAALRALELDPELAEARVVLAFVLSSYDWNWAGADAEFERAIELNPNYASARHWYARHLAFQKQFSKARYQFERARQLDPLSPYIVSDSGIPDFFQRNYEGAIEYTSRAIELDNRFWFAYWVRGWAHQQKGEISAAIADYRKAQSIEDSAIIQAFLAHAYATIGRREEARRILNLLVERRNSVYIGAPGIAAIYGALGDKEEALAWLEKGLVERDEWMIWLKYDLRHEELRKESRFQDLLRRVGLPD